MIRIGEFSRLSQVTIRTLHHYDELGLIKPVHIDPATNYRFYTLEQLPRIHRIIALKELGLSLEQIGIMLEGDISNDQIRGMLMLKQAEIQQEVRDAQRQLSMVEFRLRMIEAEEKFPDLDIVIKSLKPMHCLSFFPQIKRSSPSFKKKGMEAINRAVEEGRIQHTGVEMEIFYGEIILPFASAILEDNKVEVLFTVSDSQEEITLEPLGRLKLRDVPAVEQAATLIIAGDSRDGEGREKAILMRRWAIANGYKPLDLIRYVYYRGPLKTLNEDEYVYEAQLPLDLHVAE